MELPHFIHWLHELRRRHVRQVFRALVAYGIVAFALVEIAHPITVALHLPEWTLTFVVVVLGLGFPIVAVVAWITSDATRAPAETDDQTEGGPKRPPLGTRRVLLLVAIGLLIAAPGLTYYFVWHHRGAAAEAGTTRPPSIAVLPFVDMSPAKDQQYFADGIAEEILNALAGVQGLHVPGRTSSFFFKDKSVKLADIGRELNVATVLEGSVRTEGLRVRVTAQLVDVAGGYHLWSQTYDRELTGIFAVQDDIARSVVEALKVKLLSDSRPGVKEHRTTNPDAYNAYLLGRHFFDLGTPDGMRRAVASLEKALALDAAYAPAWAWLSVSILNSSVYFSEGGPPANVEESIQRATAAADKAVALAPDLAECWSARAWMRTSIAWDWTGAQSDFERALAINPRDANILVRQSHLLALLGRLPEAIAIARRVIEIDPLYAWAWTFLANYYDGIGRPDLARDAAGRALEIAPEQTYALRELGIAHLLLGEPDRALAAFQRHKWEVIRLTGTALAQHDLGNREEEQKALDALRARFGDREPYEIAVVYAWRGDKDGAFEWLERAFAQRGGHGVSLLFFRSFKYSPLLRKVRDDPRYPALLRKMKLPSE